MPEVELTEVGKGAVEAQVAEVQGPVACFLVVLKAVLGKAAVGGCALLVPLALLAGCSSDDGDLEEATPPFLVIDGSTSTHQLLWELAKDYEHATNAHVAIGLGGSRVGAQRLVGKEIHLASSSTDPHKQPEYDEVEPPDAVLSYVIGFDQVCVVAREDSTVKKLDKEELRILLTGRVLEGVGKAKLALPPEGSGTRTHMAEALGMRANEMVSELTSHDDLELLNSVRSASSDFAVCSSSFETTQEDSGLKIVASLDRARALYLSTLSSRVDEEPEIRAFLDYVLKHASEVASKLPAYRVSGPRPLGLHSED